ncbi:MAG: YggS family pyridoxal phosphate-dependent enzyme [Syntrophorhabdaceae bacterium]|nr:YggS family pyridoxal phosphate-dependent enzyme [Syntrophorhabdaceae bacterium]
MSSIKESLYAVKERITDACRRAGRSSEEVRLIGVTKRVGTEKIEAAIECGLRDFGENYIQEAQKKIEEIAGDVSWHMIGHIQSNKMKYIPKLFDCVHSIDRWDILEGLERYGKPIDVLFEVNVAGEDSKHGTGVDGVRRMLEKTKTLTYVKPIGLMTMAPFVDNPEEIRWVFARLRETLKKMNDEFGLTMRELSMGMSSDFEVAIEEGATMVRIGTAIFGERL